MKIGVLLLITLFSFAAFAKDKAWTVDELKERFQVRGEMFRVDASGKIMLSKDRSWVLWKPYNKKGKIENQWSSVTDEYVVAIRHSWQVQDDGSVKATIEQYGRVSGKSDPVFEKLIKKDEKVIENFEPITIVAYTGPTFKILVRFTPDFEAGQTIKAISDMPIAGHDVIVSDNEGQVWANHITHEGKYSGFSTYRGTLFFSYYPFPGAKELGTASGHTIELRLSDKKVLTMQSETAYLPEGMRAKVYGIYHPDRKSGKFPSASVMDRSLESDFVERIKTWPN